VGKVKVTIKRTGITDLMSGPGARAEIERRTKAVEDACNGESSWGGYASATDHDETRARGRVWSYARQDGKGQTERAKRMIRNLDAE
jgi:hypothetical protein